VLFAVSLGCIFGMPSSMKRMTVGRVSVVGCLLMMAAFVVLSRFTMMARSMG
jgi:hypothetical protein